MPPKREGVDALGLPYFPSSRSRPGSSAATNRAGIYTLGGNTSNSSTSLVIGRNAAAATSEPNLATQGAYSGPVPAVDAPHLSTTEAFFGRMTLTAPDNMKKKKAEEKEKKKQARKRRAERGAAAAATLINAPDMIASGSSNNQNFTISSAANNAVTLSDSPSSRQRSRRPVLPTSNSTSNLHLYTLEHSRSRSPLRPARPHSAQQTNHTFSQQQQQQSEQLSDADRRRQTNRGRSGSDLSNRSFSSSNHNVVNTAAPTYENAETSQQGRETNNTQEEAVTLPSTATQRRRDIYADLESLGLPGANESDLEDQPPPFPSYARRPISPPRMPAEGEEWTEEMRRRQEEYEMNRPPDSPPPAFRSEDERQLALDEEGNASVSDMESIEEEEGDMTSIRKDWEDDITAGYTLEERIARDQERRFRREKSPIREELEATEALEPVLSRSEREGSSQGMIGEESAPLNLGRLVMEARARRANVTESHNARSELVKSPANLSGASGSDTRRPNELESHTAPIASQVGQILLESGVDSRSSNVASTSTPVSQSPRTNPSKRSPAAGAKSRVKKEAKRVTGRLVNSGPSPSTYTSSRFRDGASAAANRRMALWGPAVRDDTQEAITERSASALILPVARSEGDLPAFLGSNTDGLSELSAPSAPRRDTSSSDIISNDEADGEAESSSDSDEAWDKEDAAFEAMQRRLKPRSISIDSSDEENKGEREADLRSRTGLLRSNSIDLARPGSNVPKAPPPLVLGRSRGGIDDYSSSSSSSSDSGIQKREDDSDDDSLSPLGEEEQEDLSITNPNHTAAIIKGKQPLRSTLMDQDHSILTPEAMTAATKLDMLPAGHFEEGSASSHDFATDEEVDRQSKLLDIEHKPRQQSNESFSRSPVGNRLKGLFSTSLDANVQQELPRRPTSISSSRESMHQSESRPSQFNHIHRDISEEASRDKERASAYTTLESKGQQHTPEQQARLDALDEISRLQRLKFNKSSSSSTSIDQTSLDALERLLSRRSIQGSQSRGGSGSGSGLTRSGAIIHRQDVPAPFVNPRSSIAPKPLGRLPTITSDTRHFPPSRNSTILPHSRKESTNGDHAVLNESTSHRNGIGTPSWLAYIPSSERASLPDPIEPDTRSISNSITGSTGEFNRRPPPLPSRNGKNRVLAMVERFEGQATPGTTTSTKPNSPVNKIASSDLLPPEADRLQALRRRPPPPPPISSKTLQSTRDDIPASVIGSNSPSNEIDDTSSNARSTQIPISSSPLPQLPIRRSNQLTTSTSSTSLSSSISRPRPLPIPPPLLRPSPPGQEQETAASLLSREEQEAADLPVLPIEPSAPRSPSHETLSTTEEASSSEVAATRAPAREASLGFTDLDLFASRLADVAPADGTNYDDLHLLAEFLGPAKSTGATAEEVEALSVGVVEVMRKRVVGKKENGKEIVKLLLNVMGVKVERCGVCLLQFKEGNMACVFPCLHVLHEDCASKLLRNTKLCPTCRIPIA